MARYGVMFTATASHVEEVEAETPKDAREKAQQEVYVSLCHECAHKLDLGEFEDDPDDPDAVFLLRNRND